MPVRLLNSSVLKWPSKKRVIRELHEWLNAILQIREDILLLGYFGSYARGNWSVGSDLDLLIVVDDSRLPFERRAIEWDVTNLSVPVDLLVYTAKEWQALIERESRFYKTVIEETVWIYERQ